MGCKENKQKNSPEASGAACVAVHHHDGVLHNAKLAEVVTEFLLSDLRRQSAHEDFARLGSAGAEQNTTHKSHF